MVNSDKLIGLFAEKHFTKEQIAQMIGITPNTLRRKLKDRKFDSDEMMKLVEVLGIDDPVSIFFTK